MSAIYQPGSDIRRASPVVSFNPALETDTDALSQAPETGGGDYQPIIPPQPKRNIWSRIAGLTLIVIGLIVGGLLVWHNVTTSRQSDLNASLTNPSSRINTQTIALSGLDQQLHVTSIQPSSVLTVNGQLDVSDSLVLQPSSQPNNATAGQIYYDQGSNELKYFNGTQFVGLGESSVQVTNNFMTTDVQGSGSDVIVQGTTDVQGSGSDVIVQGTTGSIAMFTGDNSLGNSLLVQNGNQLNTGTGEEDITIGSTTGASATTIQGGSGNLLLTTGNSSSSVSGNITIDTGSGVVSGTVVSDKTFEDGFDNELAWYGATIALSSAEAHSGSQSMAVTIDDSYWATHEDDDPEVTSVTPGHTYLFTAWVRAATVPTEIEATAEWNIDSSSTELATVTDTTTGWTEISATAVAPVGVSNVMIVFQGNNGVVNSVHYFDDVTITDLSSSSATSSVNIGSQNAEMVTLGNANEIGATTIDGGSGININGGFSTVNLNGGAINLTSSGMTLDTTGSALILTSATATTWGIGTASSGDGGNLTINAGDGAYGDNNGGNLILQGGEATGTGTDGSVIVQPQVDSTDAFSVQNAAGTNTVLSVDTIDNVLTVSSLAVTDSLTVNGHIISGGGTPSITAGTAACTSPSVSISGTDTSGTITITSGTGCTSDGTLASTTFANDFGAAPHVTLTPGNSAALTLGAYVDDSTLSTSSFSISTNTIPSDTTTYQWNYLAIQ